MRQCPHLVCLQTVHILYSSVDVSVNLLIKLNITIQGVGFCMIHSKFNGMIVLLKVFG